VIKARPLTLVLGLVVVIGAILWLSRKSEQLASSGHRPGAAFAVEPLGRDAEAPRVARILDAMLGGADASFDPPPKDDVVTVPLELSPDPPDGRL